MAFTIASWNIEGRLTTYKGGKKRGTPAKIAAEIIKLQADIVMLPEAFLDVPDEAAVKMLTDADYGWRELLYNDTAHEEPEARWGKPHFGILSRLPIYNYEIKRWGNS